MHNWRKSSHCASGECVEAAAAWRRSSSCEGGACVEAGHGPGIVLVRDSTAPDGPRLAFSAAAWTAFTAGIKDAPGRS